MGKLTKSQAAALAALAGAPEGRLKGREGWANGNTVNALIDKGLVTFIRSLWSTEISPAGRAALALGRY